MSMMTRKMRTDNFESNTGKNNFKSTGCHSFTHERFACKYLFVFWGIASSRLCHETFAMTTTICTVMIPGFIMTSGRSLQSFMTPPERLRLFDVREFITGSKGPKRSLSK